MGDAGAQEMYPAVARKDSLGAHAAENLPDHDGDNWMTDTLAYWTSLLWKALKLPCCDPEGTDYIGSSLQEAAFRHQVVGLILKTW